MASPSDPSRPFSPLVERAVELAAEWHDRTYRKGRWRPVAFETPEEAAPVRVPAMAHLTSVALTVQRAGWREKTVAAAFLHDALEDPNIHGGQLSHDAIRDELGPDVLAIVTALTERKRDDEGAPRTWRERKDEYLQQLSRAPVEAVAISLADKLHNLWTINQSLEQGIDPFQATSSRRSLSAGSEAQAWFHSAVLEASASRSDVRLEPLRRQLSEELQRFRVLTDQMEEMS